MESAALPAIVLEGSGEAPDFRAAPDGRITASGSGDPHPKGSCFNLSRFLPDVHVEGYHSSFIIMMKDIIHIERMSTMSGGLLDLRRNLRNLKFDFKLLQRQDCSDEENIRYLNLLDETGKLPEGVYQQAAEKATDSREFYTIREDDLTEKEKAEYFLLLQCKYIRTIRNALIFLVILAAFAMLALLIR
jgi:hypothetical protein